MVLAAAIAGCTQPGNNARRAVPSYDPFTGRLIQLSADQDGDGRVDQWTYLDGNRLLRGEADTDGDGRIDQWEYFDSAGALTRVGSASLADGIEDTWTFVAAANGEARIGRSRLRDRRIDRVEYYRGESLVRAEEDTDADGRLDRWERYEGGVLREAAFDTLGRGVPDRRVLYDEQGRFVGVDVDPDGDGTFTRQTGDAALKSRVGAPR